MLFRKKVLLYITTAILLSAVMVIVTPILHQFAAPYRPQQSPEQELKPEKIFILSMMLRDFAMMILTTGLSVALKMGLRWNKIEAQNKQIKSEQKEMELENLKMEISYDGKWDENDNKNSGIGMRTIDDRLKTIGGIYYVTKDNGVVINIDIHLFGNV